MNPAVTASRGPRWRRLALVALVAVAVATVVLVGRGLVLTDSVKAEPELCRNVAADRGLVFRAAYGTTPAATDPMSVMMLRNMGNGAAIADVFGDGNLSVFMLGQPGHPNRLFRNQPDASGEHAFSDVTEAAGLINKGGARRRSLRRSR